MTVHAFDPGYTGVFATLCGDYPAGDVYPVKDFRVEWGPIFHRGRLDGSAKVVVIGQDPAEHETITRRILIGEAGQRLQGFLFKLGIDTSYAMVNTFLYSVYGQGGGNRHKDDPFIAEYRNKWLDALIVGASVDCVVALGDLADNAFQLWASTPTGKSVDVTYRHIKHPTYPESASRKGTITKAEATAKLLTDWNDALPVLAKAITTPDTKRPLVKYGTAFEDGDLVAIPECDLPAGVPDWMRSLDAWASRQATGPAAAAGVAKGKKDEAKRATIVVEIPKSERPWPPMG